MHSQMLIFAVSCVVNISDGVKVDACGRKIGVAGRMQCVPPAVTELPTDRMQSMPTTVTEPPTTETTKTVDDETVDDDQPSIVIQSDTGFSQLMSSKKSFHVPRGKLACYVALYSVFLSIVAVEIFLNQNLCR